MPITENDVHLSNVRKADFTLSSLLSDGGYLLATQAAKFVRLMIKKSVAMPTMTVTGMKADKAKINKIRFGGRVLKAGTVGQALPSGDRVKPDLSETELSVELFKCEVLIEEEVFADNIEGPALRNTIMQELGAALARDMEYVIFNGDTTSADPLLAKLDGLIKQTTSHTPDAGGADLDAVELSKCRKALPHEYKDDPRKMRFWTSVNAEQDFGDSIQDRATPLGDKYFDEYPGPRYKLTPVVGVPEFPENLSPGTRTVALYCDPKNATVGIHQQIQLRTTEDIKAGNVIIVGKVRFDVKWANEDAAVKLINVSAD